MSGELKFLLDLAPFKPDSLASMIRPLIYGMRSFLQLVFPETRAKGLRGVLVLSILIYRRDGGVNASTRFYAFSANTYDLVLYDPAVGLMLTVILLLSLCQLRYSFWIYEIR
jgi:hypothetical protein